MIEASIPAAKPASRHLQLYLTPQPERAETTQADCKLAKALNVASATA